MEEIPERWRNDTKHRIIVASIGLRKMVVYEGYSPLQCFIMEQWCRDQNYNYRIIYSDEVFKF